MALDCKTGADVIKAIKANGVNIVDVRFTDLFGQWHHFSIPSESFDADEAFEEGLGFDGSSIRGFQSIDESDMILKGDPTTPTWIRLPTTGSRRWPSSPMSTTRSPTSPTARVPATWRRRPRPI